MKKKLIMILCAVVSLSLAACGGTVETDSDSRTEREVEDEDDDDDKDKEDKDKSGSGKSLFDEFNKNETIIDELSLYESTLSDVEQYLKGKDIIYEFEEDEIVTQISEDFIGYDCTYSLGFFIETTISDKDDKILYTLNTPEDFLQYKYYNNKLRERFPNIKEAGMGTIDGDEVYSLDEKTTGMEILHYLVIKIDFASDEEFVKGGKEITSYLQEKANKVSDVEVYWDKEDDITYFPTNIVKIDGTDCIEYVSLGKRYFEEGQGYSGNEYRLGYYLIPKEYWGKYIINGDSTTFTVTEAPASASEATASSTQTETPASDSASTTSQVESERKGFFPRSDIDYQALSDKFAGTYVPVDGDTEFMIHEYDEERVSYSQENGTAYMFMEQYRLDWWDYSHIISFDGTTVELSYGEEYGVVKLIYIDENTVSYRGKKYTRYKEDSQTLENVDVESEVATIRDYYYTTQDNLGSYMLEEHQNLTMYHEAGYPVKIFVKSGYNDWDYTREYFYHDQELYFAFVYNNNEQHRLYFKDGIMIRYIDENGNTFDYGNLNEFYSWEYMSLYDSYNIYPTMPNCGA